MQRFLKCPYMLIYANRQLPWALKRALGIVNHQHATERRNTTNATDFRRTIIQQWPSMNAGFRGLWSERPCRPENLRDPHRCR